MLDLLAQVPDTVAGGVSLVGTIVNGSVLAWLLLVHLPSKDKQIKELLADKDKQLQAKDEQLNTHLAQHWAALKDVMATHSVMQTSLSETFRLTLAEIAAHCEKEAERLVSLWELHTKNKVGG